MSLSLEADMKMPNRTKQKNKKVLDKEKSF